MTHLAYSKQANAVLEYAATLERSLTFLAYSKQPNAVLDYTATAENGWHAVIVNAQVGWIDGAFARIVLE